MGGGVQAKKKQNHCPATRCSCCRHLHSPITTQSIESHFKSHFPHETLRLCTVQHCSLCRASPFFTTRFITSQYRCPPIVSFDIILHIKNTSLVQAHRHLPIIHSTSSKSTFQARVEQVLILCTIVGCDQLVSPHDNNTAHSRGHPLCWLCWCADPHHPVQLCSCHNHSLHRAPCEEWL